MVHSQNKWTKTVSEEARTLDSLEKDFKSTLLNIFKLIKKIMNKRQIKELGD